VTDAARLLAAENARSNRRVRRLASRHSLRGGEKREWKRKKGKEMDGRCSPF